MFALRRHQLCGSIVSNRWRAELERNPPAFELLRDILPIPYNRTDVFPGAAQRLCTHRRTIHTLPHHGVYKACRLTPESLSGIHECIPA